MIGYPKFKPGKSMYFNISGVACGISSRCIDSVVQFSFWNNVLDQDESFFWREAENGSRACEEFKRFSSCFGKK